MEKLKRSSGVLMHISSLPGKYSCGSFGREARDFVDFLSESGFTYWQVLPFGMPDECGSPYKSLSAFAGNPYFIDIDTLYKKGLITEEERQKEEDRNPYSCNFSFLEKRFDLFMKLSQRVIDREAVESFISKRPHLERFARFMALKKSNGDKPWWEWTVFEEDKDTLFMHKFLQYEFFTEWQELKGYANAHGIKIIGDMPIYVDTDSSDVYFSKENFLLGKDLRPTLVAGVPPDYFAKDGQLWGNPIYNWQYMKKDGYTWWRERMVHTMEIYDAVRIDHFRAFSAYYTVDAKADTARDGKWNKGPGLRFVEVLKEAAGNKMIIAEDLGDIDDDVIELVKKSGLPGMRVFQFAFDGDDDTHRPHSYPENSVAYSGTHDNNTLLGYLWELDTEKKKRLLDYSEVSFDKWQSAVEPIIKMIMRSSAAITVFPIQDILGYGKDTRMNTPGVADGNWQFRITEAQLAEIDREKYAYYNRLYSRKGDVDE